MFGCLSTLSTRANNIIPVLILLTRQRGTGSHSEPKGSLRSSRCILRDTSICTKSTNWIGLNFASIAESSFFSFLLNGHAGVGLRRSFPCDRCL